MARKSKQIPDGPAVVIAQTLDLFDMTQGEMAVALGVSRLSVNELLKGKRSLTVSTALRFECVFGLDPEGLLDMQMRRDIALCRADDKFMAEIAHLKRLRKRNG